MYSACKSLKRTLDLLKLELETVGSYHWGWELNLDSLGEQSVLLGIEPLPCSFAQAPKALVCEQSKPHTVMSQSCPAQSRLLVYFCILVQEEYRLHLYLSNPRSSISHFCKDL